MATIAEQAGKFQHRNGFVTMIHQTRMANGGQRLMQSVRQDAADVFKAQGWVEYIPSPEPIEARRMAQTQPGQVQISLEEYARLQKLAKAVEETTPPEPIEEYESPDETAETPEIPPAPRGRGNWKK